MVKDVQRTAQLYQTIFDAKEVYDSAAQNFSIAYEKFFIIGGTWIAIMEGDPLTQRSYGHLAFKVSEADFDAYLTKLDRLGLEIKAPRLRTAGEARSVYFYDYDNHLFELHTGTLEERLRYYTGA